MKSWLVLMLVCVAACGDSTGPKDGVASEFAFEDPVGDTALFAGSVDTFPALDVRRVSGVVTADSLIFTMEFVGAIAPFSDGAPNSLLATLSVDSDDDRATGITAVTEPFPDKADAGVEYWIFIPDLALEHNVEVERIVTRSSVGVFPASYGSNSITLRIPLSALGIRAGDRFRVVGVIGTSQRSTDLIPDSASYVLGGSS